MKWIAGLFLTALASALAADEGAKILDRLPPPPKIISRQQWEARPPVLPMKEHTLQFITIHHSGTKQKPERPILDKIKALQAFSQRDDTLANGKKKPAWPDVPYHFYIGCEGEIVEGREIKFIGDTNTEYDPTGHILVCLEGSFGSEKPAEAQVKSLRKLVPWLAQKYKIPSEKIGAHKDYASTSCPGESLYQRMEEIRGWVKK